MITMIKLVPMEHVKDGDILWKIFVEIKPSDVVNFPVITTVIFQPRFF